MLSTFVSLVFMSHTSCQSEKHSPLLLIAEICLWARNSAIISSLFHIQCLERRLPPYWIQMAVSGKGFRGRMAFKRPQTWTFTAWTIFVDETNPRTQEPGHTYESGRDQESLDIPYPCTPHLIDSNLVKYKKSWRGGNTHASSILSPSALPLAF